MAQLIADHVLLAGGATAKTQSVLLGANNRVLVDVLYMEVEGGSATSGVKVCPEYSNDLENWVDDAAAASPVETGSEDPPYRKSKEFKGPTIGIADVNPYLYVRLNLENEDSGLRALLCAWVTLYTQDT